MFAYMIGCYGALCIFGGFVALKFAPVLDEPAPVRFDPPLNTVDDLLNDDELLTEVLAVEVDAFIEECLGETA